MQAAETVLHKLLGGQQHFMVPLFQRVYTWTQENWEALWRDVVETYELGPHESHFLGSIVTKSLLATPQGVAPFLVIDGQQRLTTLTILLAALRDDAKETLPDQAGKIQNLYLTNQYASGNTRYKVLPTQRDRDDYFAVIEGIFPVVATSARSSIVSAYEFFRSRLAERRDHASPFHLERLTQTVVGGLEIVSITLGEEDNEYRIFESLNGTGMPLTQADLLRNFFFMRIPTTEQDAIYNDVWLPLQRALDTNLEDFFRYELMSLDGQFVRQGDIYQEWKKQLEKLPPAELIARLRRLARDGQLYHRLIAPAAEQDIALGRQISRLNRWGIQTFYPFLLNIYRRYVAGDLSALQFVEILRILESFLVRRFFARVPTNQLNRLFIRLAQQLPADLDLVSATRAALSKPGLRWPDDAEFRAAILRLPLYTEGRYEQRRLIIESLEMSYGHKEVIDLGTLTIEHVMPQSLTPEWRAALGGDAEQVHDSMLHVLGNLTLSGYNPELSNRPFSEKRAALAHSHLEMNKSISQAAEWTRTQIEERTQLLAERALALWPGPIPSVSGDTDSPATMPRAGGATNRGRPRDRESVLAALAAYCSPAGFAAVQHLCSYSIARGGALIPGTGTMPSITARLPCNGKHVSVFSLSEWPAGRAILSINFEYLSHGGVSPGVLSHMASQLRGIPGLGEALKGLEESQFKKRPSLPIEDVLTKPGAVEKIVAMLDMVV